jgi:hypothetical protein
MTPLTGPSGPTPEDDELLAELRSVVGLVDPAPPDLSAASRSLLSWRDADAQLAELVTDSRALAGSVRGDTDVVLRFLAGPIEIVVQLSPGGDGNYRLVGQIAPAAAGTLYLRRSAGRIAISTDDLGRFVAERVGPGPISLRWTPDGDGDAVETAWQLV